MIDPKEFETNKAISKPPRPIPGMDDDEVIFFIMYFMFFIVFYVLGLGILPDMLGIRITQDLIKSYAFITFLALPTISIILIKMFKQGKRIGFLEQSLIIFFKTNLDTKIDLRDSEQRKSLKKLVNTPLKMINGDEFYKNSKINGEKIERYNDVDIINQHIKEQYEKEYRALTNHYNKTKHISEMQVREVNDILNDYYKFMD